MDYFAGFDVWLELDVQKTNHPIAESSTSRTSIWSCGAGFVCSTISPAAVSMEES